MKKLAIIVALGTAVASGSAQATVFTITYTGTMAVNGIDDTNYFGLGTDMTGPGDRQVTLQYRMDSSVRPPVNTPGIQELAGTGALNPILETLFTLNGRAFGWTKNEPGGFGLAFRVENHAIYDDALGNKSWSNAGNLEANVNFPNDDILTTTDVTAALDYTGTNIGSGRAISTLIVGGTYLRDFNFGFSFSRVTVSSEDVSPVPEPATWSMMIGGFGMVGGAMRRRVAVGYA